MLQSFLNQLQNFSNLLHSFLGVFVENFNYFIFPYLDIIITVALFFLLFSRSVKNKSKHEYPSFAKELELEEKTIANLLSTYLDAPVAEPAVVEEVIPAPPAPAPAPIEEPAVVPHELEGQRTTKTKRRKKRKVQKPVFVFNAQEAIIYNTILTRKY
ncbi:MAG: hypothetical protein ACPG5B_00855 [Chitinophagales bacterium]